MGKPKAPKAPNPYAVGAAQTGTNVSTAIANQIGQMVGQNTPYGSEQYDQTGSFSFTDPNSGKTYSLPQFTKNTTLNQAGQYLLGKTQQSQKNLADLSVTQSSRLNQIMGKAFNLDGVPGRTAVPGGNDWSKDRGRVEAALMSRLNPSIERDRSSLDNTLRQQGLVPGSEAYERAMGLQGNQATDARMQAILAGGQEQSRLAGLDMASWQAQEQARAAGLNEAFQMRSQPINEIMALQSGAQVQNPTFGATPGLNMPTTDYAGLINQNYGNQMGAYQQKMENWNGLFGGLIGGGAKIGAAMLSDRRAKTDIKQIGVADNGLPIYRYRYKSGGPIHIGVMAQDVLEFKPSAVVDMGEFMGVDYAEAFS